MYDADEVKIRVGSSEINYGGMVFDIEFYTLHRNYPEDHSDTTDYDVALVKLAYPLKFTEDIQPIMFPFEPEYVPEVGTKAYVSGWGRTEVREFNFKALFFIQVIYVLVRRSDTQNITRSRG